MNFNNKVSTILCFVLFILAVPYSYGQDCIPGEVILNSQYEIDNFANAYPDCTEIIGSLQVHSTGTNVNLQGLSQIKSIGGNLEIKSNNQLFNLEGLESLESIGGDFILFYNNNLISISGLESLHTIGGKLEIRANGVLPNLNGLPNLLSINGDIIIFGNANLQDIGGINNLQTIKGNATIEFTDKLSNINGFNSLKSIDGDFTINDNSSLKNFDGLDSLEQIGKSLTIRNNDQLKGLAGFNSINFIGNSFILSNNDQLESMEGFGTSKILGLDLLSIRGNDALGSLAGIEHIDLIHIPEVIIKKNDVLLKCAVKNICDRLAKCFAITFSENDGNACNILSSLKILCKENFEDFKIKCKIDLFPNPANNTINVRILGDNLEDIKYEIFDMTGRLVLSGLRQSELIDISNLLAGPYLLRISNDEQVEVFRFVRI